MYTKKKKTSTSFYTIILLYSPRLRFTCGFYVNLIFTAKLLIFIMLFIFIAGLGALLVCECACAWCVDVGT